MLDRERTFGAKLRRFRTNGDPEPASRAWYFPTAIWRSDHWVSGETKSWLGEEAVKWGRDFVLPAVRIRAVPPTPGL